MKIRIDLQLLIRKLISGIKRRTLSGKDRYIRDFKPYTPEYAKTKKSNTPNLYLSGQMLNSMIPKGMNSIGFSNALAQNKRVYNKDRDFFGLDYNQMKQIDQYITRRLDKEITRCMKRM